MRFDSYFSVYYFHSVLSTTIEVIQFYICSVCTHSYIYKHMHVQCSWVKLNGLPPVPFHTDGCGAICGGCGFSSQSQTICAKKGVIDKREGGEMALDFFLIEILTF